MSFEKEMSTQYAYRFCMEAGVHSIGVRRAWQGYSKKGNIAYAFLYAFYIVVLSCHYSLIVITMITLTDESVH